MYDNVREFKHDYMKIYSSMSILLENNNIDELKNFFYSSIVPLQNDIFESSTALHTVSKIHNEIIQGVIYSYALKAKNIGINFNINIADDIPDLPEISAVDFARILGIFLDNAFEAALKSTERLVAFGAVHTAQNVVFVIKNSFDTAPDLGRIFEENYSLKGKDRGIGMGIAKRLVDRYENVYLDVGTKDRCFIIKISFVI